MAGKKLRTKRIFLISGISEETRGNLGEKIKALGGVYNDTEIFEANCTHVICGKLSRGEKFLGACAMGKWVLVPEYITASAEAGKWLEEAKYEWCQKWDKKGDYSPEMLAAPLRWRKCCAVKKQGAFFNWKVAIIIDSLKRKSVYKRLLENGGAKVYKLPPLAKSSHKLYQVLTHVLVNQDDGLTLEGLVREGYPCYPPNYIGDFLIQDVIAVDTVSVNTSSLTLGSKKHNILHERINGSQNVQNGVGSKCSKDEQPFKNSGDGKVTFDGKKLSKPVNGKKCALKQRHIDNYYQRSPTKSTPMSCHLSFSQSLSSLPSSCSQSLSTPPDRSFNLTPVTLSQSSSKTRESCGNIFSCTPSKTMSSNASCFHSSCVTPRVSPALRTLLPQDIRSKDALSMGEIQRKSSLKQSVSNIADTSDCFVSSYQANVKNFMMKQSDICISNDSVKANKGSCTISEISSNLTSVDSLKSSSISTNSTENSSGSDKRRSVRISQKGNKIKLEPESRKSNNLFGSNEGIEIRRSVRILKKVENPKSKSLSSSEYLSTSTKSETRKTSVRKSTRNFIKSASENSYRSETSSSNLLLPDGTSSDFQHSSKTSKSSAGFSDWSKCRGDSSEVSDGTSFLTSPSCFNLTSDNGFKKPVFVPSSPVNSSISSRKSILEEQFDGRIEGMSEVSSIHTKASLLSVSNYISDTDSSHILSTTLTSPTSECPREITMLKAQLLKQEDKEINQAKQETKKLDNRRNVTNESQISKNEKVIPRRSNRIGKRKFFPSSDEASSVSDQKMDVSATSVKIEDESVFQQPACETPTNLVLKRTEAALKRQIFNSPDSPDHCVPFKRKKFVHDFHRWRPTIFGVLPKRQAPPISTDLSTPIKKRCFVGVSMPMNSASSGLIETCLDDDYVSSALDVLSSVLSNKTYPQPEMIHTVMTRLLRDAQSLHQAHRAYEVLWSMLTKHPPHPDHPAIRATYLKSLRPVANWDEIHGTDKQFLLSLIRSLVSCTEESGEETSDISYQCGALLLQYIVAFLETDMSNLTNSKNVLCVRDIKCSLLGEIFWQGTNQIAFDKHFKELLDLLVEALELWKTDQNKVLVVELLLKLISMLAQCLVIVDEGGKQINNILKGERVTSLIYELSRRLSVMCESVLRLTLTRLRPSWVGLGVSKLLLDAMDDSLLTDTAILIDTEDEELTLTRLVKYDMYLLPPLTRNQETPVKRENSPAVKKSPPSSGSKSCSSQTSKTSSKSSNSKINKRNYKGETTLHTACKSNNVTRLKKLLATPGIDVNIADNSGLTPLHEACHKGHVTCVTELLKYKPARTISSYFDNGFKERRTDLLAASVCGVTPLHEAVLKNRLEVAQVLMQYGGKQLLEASTAVGETPRDLCTSDEMRSILDLPDLEISSTPRKIRRAINLSQGSQDSQNSFLFSQGNSSQRSSSSSQPCLETYQRILGEGLNRYYATEEECLKFMCLLQNCIHLYISMHSLSGEDLKVYQKLGSYLDGFRTHLKQICRPEDYKRLKTRLHTWICLCV